MKTYADLYEKIYNYKNLFNSYLKARRGKRYRDEVLKFSYNLEENLIIIQNELIYKEYCPSRFREFFVYDPKKRLISAPAFKDRIVHHALVNVIEPLFEKKFIAHSYACRIGKGNHRAMKKVQEFIRKCQKDGKVYILKGDISKYFPSVTHDILKKIIRKTIRCKNTLWLIDKIIDSPGEESGLPIGSLTSQLFANVYLNELDHFLKDELSIKFYVRYMDDFVVVHNSKEYLKNLLDHIVYFLENTLKLKLNPKSHVFPAKQGVDFCGYRVWATHILPRKRIIKKTRRMFKKLMKLYAKGEITMEYIQRRIVSFLGYVKHCNANFTVEKIFEEFVLQKEERRLN